MNIDINQYDLSELFRFDLLKNILQNITTEQKKLSEEINELKLSNKVRDEKINGFEKFNNLKFLGLEDELNDISDELSENIDKKNMTFEKMKKSNNINEENQNKFRKTADNKNNIFNKKDKSNITLDLDNSKKSKKRASNEDNKNKISKAALLFFMKEIQSLEEKIINLEKNLTNNFENQFKKIENVSIKNITSLLEENKLACKQLDDQVNDILKNKEEQNKKIEECVLKCDSVDIYNLLKDTGDSNIDAAKLMVSSLEEKIFKKFAFIDERNKIEEEKIVRLLKSDENTKFKIEKILKNLNEGRYNDLTKEREFFLKNMNEYDKKILDIVSSIKEQEINLSQKIDDVEKNFLVIIEEKEENINKKQESFIDFQNQLTKIEREFNDSINKQSKIIKDVEKDVDKKFNLSKNKINSIENTVKVINTTFVPDEFREYFNEIREKLRDKITKEQLKELYNLNENNIEYINNMRHLISTLKDELKKVTIDVDALLPKVNSFNNYLIAKKAKKKEPKNEINLDQFVNNEKYEEGIKYFKRRIDSIFVELESIKRNLDDLNTEQKTFEKKEMVIKIKEEFNNLLEESKSKMKKNRGEINKQIKGIETEIKSIREELKKKEGSDNWILAKHPLKCFNCASCDNDIKIDSPKEEFIPWNKILPYNRSYRLGKGFSHMLEKMSTGFINNMEDSSQSKENSLIYSDKNAKNNSYYNLINKSTQIEDNKMKANEKNNIFPYSIAQIERCSSQSDLLRQKGRNVRIINNVKMRFPQLIDSTKRKAIFETFKNINSLTDREKAGIPGIIENSIISPNNQQLAKSPKMIKIKKKNGE